MAFSFPIMGLCFCGFIFGATFIYSPVWKDASSEVWNLKFHNGLLKKTDRVYLHMNSRLQAKAEETVVYTSVMLSLRWLIASDNSSNCLIRLSNIFGDEIVLLSLGSCRMLDKKCLGLSLNTITDWPPKKPLKMHSIYFTHKAPTAKLRC